MAYSNLSNAQKQARAAAINTALGSNATIRIYSGNAPAGPDTAATGTLLVTLVGNASGFGTATNGVVTAAAITQANAVATGTAGWARLSTSGATAVLDVDVGVSGASVNMNTTSIVTGGPVQITSLTISEVAYNQ